MTTFTVDKRTKRRFDSDPKLFIEKAIKNFVRTSPANRLTSFHDQPIFDEPLIGFADGDDPLFAEFKKIVHEKHLSPREILSLHLTETLKHETAEIGSISVISFVLPIPAETKPFFEILLVPGGFASKWSQRHIAYAAGLGTFSLNDGFITSKGLAVRCGSIVTNLKLEPSIRPYTHHLANCLFYATDRCGKCILRCPGGAISEKGHDKLKCFQMLFEKQKPWIEGAYGKGYIGEYAGCGLCQTGVPCENRIPVPESKQQKVD